MKYKDGIAERDGKWYIMYYSNQRNSNGYKKKVQEVCPVDIKTRSQAKRFREQQMQLVYQGKIGIGKDALFLDLLKQYDNDYITEGLNPSGKALESSTILTFDNNSNHLMNMFGNHKLSELTSLEIEKIFNKKIIQNSWSFDYARSILISLKDIFEYGVKLPNYDLHINYATNIKLIKDIEKKEDVIFETNDINNLVDYLINKRNESKSILSKYKYQRNLILVVMGAFHGLRRSEMAALRWENVHLNRPSMDIVAVIDTRSIRVLEKSKLRKTKMATMNWITPNGLIPFKKTNYMFPNTKIIKAIYKEHGKTESSLVNDHPLNPDWLNEIEYLKELQSDLMQSCNLILNESDFMFTPVTQSKCTCVHQFKRPMTPGNINSVFDKLLDEEIIKKDQTVHKLRHYFGSQLVAMLNRPLQTDSSGNVIPNPSLPQLAKLMRHGDAGETLMRTYAHAFEQSYQENKFEWMSSIGKVDQLRIV